jgi:transcriptional antiterminator Rof (Rho-off)
MTDEHNSYTPISCGQHSRYELAVLRCVELQLAWRNETGSMHICRVIPLDLITDNHEEYLLVKTPDGVKYRIRLDYIEHSDVDEVIE